MFFPGLRGVALRAGQSDGHLGTEMKRSVVPAAGFDGLDGDICPFRKLSSHQALDEVCIDMHGIRQFCISRGWEGAYFQSTFGTRQIYLQRIESVEHKIFYFDYNGFVEQGADHVGDGQH